MVFNATFNNISVISWRRKPEYPEKTTDLPLVTDVKTSNLNILIIKWKQRMQNHFFDIWIPQEILASTNPVLNSE
jgi:hypothetical protein